MTLTPDDQRLILFLVSAFDKSLPKPEKEEAWSLVARIQQQREIESKEQK